MKRIIDCWCDGIPSDTDIQEAISIATIEEAIVRINWVVAYNGAHTVMVYDGDTVEIVRKKMPKKYGV